MTDRMFSWLRSRVELPTLAHESTAIGHLPSDQHFWDRQEVVEMKRKNDRCAMPETTPGGARSKHRRWFLKCVAAGAAVVPVRVPDRLTTWRVLALAHSRTGAQAGAVTRSTAIDSTYIKAQRAAFGGKGGIRSRQSAVRAGAGRPKSTRSPTSSAAPMR